MALIMVLAALALISALVLAFFSQAILNRQISFLSAGQSRAQFLAGTAMQTIKGDLRDEIAAGSTATTVSGFTLYQPIATANMVPARMATLSGLTNLVKWSAGASNFWTASANYGGIAGPARAASGNLTANSSVNGRSIPRTRWDTPLLGNAVPASFTPAWIVITRCGSATNAATLPAVTELAKNGSSNADFVLGRYAYAIYNVGGLLDVNVSGAISTDAARKPSAEQVARKGSLAYADLTQIGLTAAQADKIVSWRNPSSAATSAAYTNYISNVAPATGYLAVADGDQAFLSRQDLIRYWTNDISGTTTALRYLTTFSREKNAPSWAPAKNGSELGGVDSDSGPPVMSYAYRNDADTATSFNRALPNVRVTTPFTREDGTTPAVAGEPLLSHRFDLNRISWITYNDAPPTGVTAALILQNFGLTRNSDGSWTYDHGDAKKIYTLDEVAAKGREPDFFEILQAAILRGSLGLYSGDPTKTSDIAAGGELYRMTKIGWQTTLARQDVDSKLMHQLEKYQIIQIGANIIDQYDADSFPTEIKINGESFYGNENLPYINSLGHTIFRPPPGNATVPNNYQAYVHMMMTVALWNPHQNAAIAPTNGPQRFRILVRRGDVTPDVHDLPVGAGTNPAYKVPPFRVGKAYSEAHPGWMEFNVADYAGRFSEPTMLDYDHTTVSEDGGKFSAFGWKRAGIYLGYTYAPDNPAKVAACSALPASEYPTATNSYNAANLANTIPMNVELQYMDSTSNAWRNYQALYSVIFSRDGRGDPYMAQGDPAWLTCSVTGGLYGPMGDREGWVVALLDPRSDRFCMTTRVDLYLAKNLYNNGGSISVAVGPHFPKVITIGSYSDQVANFVNNNATSNPSYYTDRDYVMRPGDASGWAAANPLVTAAASSRPLMLDRPFRSVAELGYAFRDTPWRTLDFDNATSADAALLDFFCIGGGAGPKATTPVPTMVSGKINLNSAPPEVIKSLVAGAVRTYQASDPKQVGTTISNATDIANLALSWSSTLVSAGLAKSPADIVKVMPALNLTPAIFPANKASREAIVRALADCGQVRTWNLLVDLFVQTGRYPKTATTMDQFLVEGEKHFWVHVAIDRYTGEVVDEQWEAVQE